MSQRLSSLGEEMGTTRLLSPFETLMTTQLQRSFMPDQSGPGLRTTALTIDDFQGGNVKYATDDHNVNHNAKLKLAKNNFTTGTWDIRTMYCQGKLNELAYEMERYKWHVIGLAETGWTGAGEITTEGHTLWYSERRINM